MQKKIVVCQGYIQHEVEAKDTNQVEAIETPDDG